MEIVADAKQWGKPPINRGCVPFFWNYTKGPSGSSGVIPKMWYAPINRVHTLVDGQIPSYPQRAQRDKAMIFSVFSLRSVLSVKKSFVSQSRYVPHFWNHGGRLDDPFLPCVQNGTHPLLMGGLPHCLASATISIECSGG